MDIGSAFTFMFDDADWIKKILIGGAIVFGALLLSPILVGLVLFFPLLGYMLEVLKNVRQGQPTPLPEWSDFGALFMTGLMVFIISLVYNIPALIFAGIGVVANIVAASGGGDTAEVLGIVSACLSCVQIVLSLLAYFLLPAGLIRYARYETLGSAFQFGEIFSFISGNLGDYIITVVVAWVAALISMLGIILCGIGVFFTYFWGMLVTGNLFGQLARKAEVI